MTSRLRPEPDGHITCPTCADHRSDVRCHTHDAMYCDTCHPCPHRVSNVTPDGDTELTAREAADLFGLPIRTIYEWTRRRRLTPSRLLIGPGRNGHTPLYRLAEVADLAATRHANNPPNNPPNPQV